MMVPVVEETKDEWGKTKKEYFFHKNYSYNQYTTLTIELPSPVIDEKGNLVGEEMKEHIFYADKSHPLANDDNLFAILTNNLDMAPDLEDIDEELEYLGFILDAIFYDGAVSKKQVYFLFPQD